ncbi:glycosyltransferase [Pararhodonellum marinum]|uniref:glycosyltransferase n=1 Tax=Pararhodonellum marinum TaxID=2755358 RepID=UPI00188E27D6|nr:glycosyltransferase [Pararhodonellum marinum]
MLSIVICSIDVERLRTLKENIRLTVGVPYEIIAIDNSIDPRGITSVYNQGAKEATFENLLFVHEDVKFNTQDWGKLLVDNLSQKNVGLVGIAGCAYKTRFPTGWISHGLEYRLIKINLIQHYKYEKKESLHAFQRIGEEKLARVACVDGVFLATKKKVVEEFPFDESLKGFHGYDIDFAIAVNQKYEVYVTFEVLVEHFSEGTLNSEWIESTFYINQKWADQLPLNPLNLIKREMAICEKHTFRTILKFFSQHVPIGRMYGVLKISALKQLDYATYLKMYFSLAKAYLSKQEKS